MGLETGTYISDLVATNPVGATDPKSAGDNHIRLLKATILATFAAITGAVTASHTELNNLTGVTGKTGTGNLVLSASPTLTGTVTAATVAATTLTGAGSGITALNASNLASGTVPDARFPATLPAASGANLTALNGTQVTTGTVANARLDLSAVPAASLTGSIADARLSANVPLLNAANVFTGAAPGIQMNGTNQYLGITDTTCQGYFQATSTDLRFGALSNHPLFIRTNGIDRLTISAAGNFNFVAGTVTTSNTSASEVGYKGAPHRNVSSSDNTAASDAGGTIKLTGGSAQTFTLDADPPVDSIVYLLNASGASWTLACSGTLTANGGTGSFSFIDKKGVIALHQGSGNWYVIGI